MKLFKWVNGRQQDTAYKKFCFLYFRIGKFGFDGYIIKYDRQTVLDWHKDVVENGKHWRLNINLSGDNIFYIKDENKFPTIKLKVQEGFGHMELFRPDKYYHKVETFTKCKKLSLGFVKFN